MMRNVFNLCDAFLVEHHRPFLERPDASLHGLEWGFAACSVQESFAGAFEVRCPAHGLDSPTLSISQRLAQVVFLPIACGLHSVQKNLPTFGQVLANLEQPLSSLFVDAPQCPMVVGGA